MIEWVYRKSGLGCLLYILTILIDREKEINMQEKFEKFIEKYWRLVIIGVALVYIGTGLFQIITGIEFDPTKMRGIEGFLMVIAIASLFYGKKKERERMQQEAAEQEEQGTSIEQNEINIEDPGNN